MDPQEQPERTIRTSIPEKITMVEDIYRYPFDKLLLAYYARLEKSTHEIAAIFTEDFHKAGYNQELDMVGYETNFRQQQIHDLVAKAAQKYGFHRRDRSQGIKNFRAHASGEKLAAMRDNNIEGVFSPWLEQCRDVYVEAKKRNVLGELDPLRRAVVDGLYDQADAETRPTFLSVAKEIGKRATAFLLKKPPCVTFIYTRHKEAVYYLEARLRGEAAELPTSKKATFARKFREQFLLEYQSLASSNVPETEIAKRLVKDLSEAFDISTVTAKKYIKNNTPTINFQHGYSER